MFQGALNERLLTSLVRMVEGEIRKSESKAFSELIPARIVNRHPDLKGVTTRRREEYISAICSEFSRRKSARTATSATPVPVRVRLPYADD